MQERNKIRDIAKNSWKMKFFMFMNLPMGFIAGLKILEINSEKAQISVPNKFINKNPFKSMYFAVQSMAAELSSGILAISEVAESKRNISMLVLNMKASFTKKARSKVVFTCNDGDKIRNAIAESIKTGEGQTVDVTSKGIDKEGDTVAEFVFTWTFKLK